MVIDGGNADFCAKARAGAKNLKNVKQSAKSEPEDVNVLQILWRANFIYKQVVRTLR